MPATISLFKSATAGLNLPTSPGSPRWAACSGLNMNMVLAARRPH